MSRDVSHWESKLKEGPTATLALAQHLADDIKEYITRLELCNAADQAPPAPRTQRLEGSPTLPSLAHSSLLALTARRTASTSTAWA